jgi:heme/copper-type cytochrome/quinol oxidase subunit 2
MVIMATLTAVIVMVLVATTMAEVVIFAARRGDGNWCRTRCRETDRTATVWTMTAAILMTKVASIVSHDTDNNKGTSGEVEFHRIAKEFRCLPTENASIYTPF